MRRPIEEKQIDLVLQRPGLADESDLTSPTVVLIKDKARGDKRCWAAFLAPRLVRRRMRVFHHDKWELTSHDAPLDEAGLNALLAEAEALSIPAIARDEGRTRGRATYTLKIRIHPSHAAVRYRWVGRGPETWSLLVAWADRFRRFVDPSAHEMLERDNGRLEELETFAEELDDEFRKKSIAEHVVEWRRELTRLGAAFEGSIMQSGSHSVDPETRVRKVSAQIDAIYDVMKAEQRDKGGTPNWPPPRPG